MMGVGPRKIFREKTVIIIVNKKPRLLYKKMKKKQGRRIKDAAALNVYVLPIHITLIHSNTSVWPSL